MQTREPTGPEVLDYYPTPPWAARAVGDLVRALDPLEGMTAVDGAAGGGHFVHGLRDYFAEVKAADIFDYKSPIGPFKLADFLSQDWTEDVGEADWFATNPPFKTAEDFARLSWKRARRGVVLVCRLAFLETIDRYALLYGDHKLAVVAPFSERVPMHKGRWEPDGDTTTAYAAFIWLKPPALATSPFRHVIEACWAHGGALTLPIAPGAKLRHHRREDVELFCSRREAPLLERLL